MFCADGRSVSLRMTRIAGIMFIRLVSKVLVLGNTAVPAGVAGVPAVPATPANFTHMFP